MKPIAAEWVAKAEGDFASLQREALARKHPNYDDVCFHAQQCAEKYLKARLAEAGTALKKIHDLEALLDLAIKAEPFWEGFRPDLAFLTEFAVEIRYPGETASRETARAAEQRCRRFRCAARESLGLKDDQESRDRVPKKAARNKAR